MRGQLIHNMKLLSAKLLLEDALEYNETLRLSFLIFLSCQLQKNFFKILNGGWSRVIEEQLLYKRTIHLDVSCGCRPIKEYRSRLLREIVQTLENNSHKG